MGSGGYILLGVISLALILVFLIRYAIRAIDEGRPGWASPPEERGICCPNAVGHKGETGQPGREENELQS